MFEGTAELRPALLIAIQQFNSNPVNPVKTSGYIFFSTRQISSPSTS